MEIDEKQLERIMFRVHNTLLNYEECKYEGIIPVDEFITIDSMELYHYFKGLGIDIE